MCVKRKYGITEFIIFLCRDKSDHSKKKVNLYYVFTSNTITQEALLAENKLRSCFSVAEITLKVLLQIL